MAVTELLQMRLYAVTPVYFLAKMIMIGSVTASISGKMILIVLMNMPSCLSSIQNGDVDRYKNQRFWAR